jgi:hypothetical protein
VKFYAAPQQSSDTTLEESMLKSRAISIGNLPVVQIRMIAAHTRPNSCVCLMARATYE